MWDPHERPSKHIAWSPRVKWLGRVHSSIERNWLETSFFFFSPFIYWMIIWSFFTWALCLWLSIIFTSKIKGDLWWDGQFIPGWQVGCRQGCSSLKLSSNCQRRFLIDHLKRMRKLASQQSRRYAGLRVRQLLLKLCGALIKNARKQSHNQK